MFVFRIVLIIAFLCWNITFSQERNANVKFSDQDTLFSGYYLYKGKGLSFTTENVNHKLVKRNPDGSVIVKIEGFLIRKSVDGHFFQINDNWKLSNSLQNGIPRGKQLYSVKTSQGEVFLQKTNLKAEARFKDFFIIEATREQVLELLYNPEVLHINLYTRPKVEAPVQFHDLTINRVNLAHHNFPRILGRDLRVSIKEQLFDTTDIDFKNRYLLLGKEDEEVDRHATLIATLVAGAGNKAKSSQGVAPGAILTSSTFTQVFPSPSSYYTNNAIFVENHSYGGDIDINYANEAAAYDQIVNEIPQLVHVFSSGNSGSETPGEGTYSGISGFANLTGNYKTAKNVITVGAVNRTGEVLERSSQGPTHDGRVKPELVAYGIQGTSDAAALVSGSALLIQDLYSKTKGSLPPATLVKAVLIAGAEDVGPQHVDFTSGFGMLDTNHSLKIINESQYFGGRIGESQILDLPLELPQKTGNLKVVLVWNDPAANPGDSPVLVNNLDLSVSDSKGETWLPWVLNPEASKSSLEGVAQRKRDDLNNVEMVSFHTKGGTLSIKVSAQNLQKAQKFFIAYSFEPDKQFEWTFPIGGDPILAGSTQVLRWNSSFDNEVGSVDYRYDDGPWLSLKKQVASSEEFLEWVSPGQGGKFQLRMAIDDQVYVSDPFVISEEIVPEVDYNCLEEIGLSWTSVPQATSYILENVGYQYREVIGHFLNNSAKIKKSSLNSEYLSVTPVFGELRGFPGVAIDYSQQGVKCYYNNFFAYLQEEGLVEMELQLSTLREVAGVRFFKVFEGTKKELKEYSFPLNSQLSFLDQSLTAGNTDYYAEIELHNGSVVTTEKIRIFFPSLETFTVYPNPLSAGEILSIDSRGDQLDFLVYDLQGRVVFREKLLRFHDLLELSLRNPGIYILQALREGEVVGTKKLIVK